jgi:hypothetical protein
MPGGIPAILTAALLCVPILGFHLWLLTRWSDVKRPWAWFLGAGGVALIIVAQFFVVGLPRDRGLYIVAGVISLIGVLVALAGAFLSTFSGELGGSKQQASYGQPIQAQPVQAQPMQAQPMQGQPVQPQQTQQPPQQQQPPQG